MRPLLVLLTDFGQRDPYVASVQGVVLSRCRDATILHASHDIAPGDVEEGARFLASCHATFPAATVFLAVVDPGVGSDRRLIVVAAGRRFYVGPDNGLLEAALRLEGAEVREIIRTDLWRSGQSATFHGRDRLAPVAAALLDGESFERLGPRICDPVRLPWREPEHHGGVVHGQVVRIDRFGNAITDLPSALLASAMDPFCLTIETETGPILVLHHVTHYAEIAADAPAALAGSDGTIEVSVRDGSFVANRGVRCGDRVRIQDRGLDP